MNNYYKEIHCDDLIRLQQQKKAAGVLYRRVCPWYCLHQNYCYRSLSEFIKLLYGYGFNYLLLPSLTSQDLLPSLIAPLIVWMASQLRIPQAHICRALANAPQLQSLVLSNVKPTGKKLGEGSYGCVEELDFNRLLCAGKRIYVDQAW